MGWMDNLLDSFVADKKGLSFGKAPVWKVSCCKDLPMFLKALNELLPPGSVLYLEGGPALTDMQPFFEARMPEQTADIAPGTTWPRPQNFHMKANMENLYGLAKLTARTNPLAFAWHLHVYKDGQLLLQWYDAFMEPLFISKDIAEDKIKGFCETLGLQYSVKPSAGS